MGLLDEAIREHLELKLRNGADPQQVALQEHEALDPVEVEPADQRAFADEEAAFEEQPDLDLEPDAEGPPLDAAATSEVAPQETVEFDMRTVIEPAEEQPSLLPEEQLPRGSEQLGLE